MASVLACASLACFTLRVQPHSSQHMKPRLARPSARNACVFIMGRKPPSTPASTNVRLSCVRVPSITTYSVGSSSVQPARKVRCGTIMSTSMLLQRRLRSGRLVGVM